MNIFFTNSNPYKAASEHCYVHTVKMIVEYAQLLSTAHHVLDGDDAIIDIYRKTHTNHPSAIWVRESSEHYIWVYKCAMELCKSYSFNTGKRHKTQDVLERLVVLPNNIKDKGFTKPPVAAPEEFKIMSEFSSVEKAYQAYLKSKFNEWSNRDKPIKVEFKGGTPEWMKTKPIASRNLFINAKLIEKSVLDIFMSDDLIQCSNELESHNTLNHYNEKILQCDANITISICRDYGINRIS